LDWLLLALALFNLASVAAIYVPRSLPSAAQSWGIFFLSLLATELAWLWLPLQAVLAILLVLGGALESTLGVASLIVLAGSWVGLAVNIRQAFDAGTRFESALVAGLGSDYRIQVPETIRNGLEDTIRLRHWGRPFDLLSDEVELVRDIQYADGGVRRRLDIYRPKNIPAEACPVLLQIHGGGLIMGNKRQQALPLMSYMASKGWICVAPNYRLSPSVGFPTHLEDIKTALGWVRTHGAGYGMDTSFVAATGGSAGGMLTALMGLTAGNKDLQKDYPELDLSLQACVPLYGSYDLHHHGESPSHLRDRFNKHRKFMEDQVMHCTAEQNSELWDLASSTRQVHEDAPPFMVIHGDLDSLLAVGDAREFSAALGRVSKNKVVYAELPGAEHGYDAVHSPRTDHTIRAIHRFLEWARAQPVEERSPS
jgi:acetyl esterase/lipase